MNLHPWQSLRNAPKDGSFIWLGWIVNPPTLEHEALSYWSHGRWHGNWTPTHWRKYVGPPQTTDPT